MKTDLAQLETEELEKLISDRYWRLNNLYWIMDEQGNKIKFRVNRVQYLLYKMMWWLNIILKSRQHGITTFICILFLDACLFNNDIRCGIIAHSLNDAKRIFRDKIKYAYDGFLEEFPELAQDCKPVKDDTLEVLFENNSGIYVGTSMRSGTLQYLHISEYGWTCTHAPLKAKEIKTGAMETIHAGGIIFIEATAEGYGTDFHAMCKDAEAIVKAGQKPSKMEYQFHFFAWYDKPENVTDPEPAKYAHLDSYFDGLERMYGLKLSPSQRTWYALKKRTLGTAIFKEHPSTPEEAFLASIEGSYYGPELIALKEKGNLGYFPHISGVPVHTWWDLGTTYTSIWFFQFRGEGVYAIDHYIDDLGKGLPHYARVLQEKKYVYGEHWTGPDNDPLHGSNGKNGFTGVTVMEDAARLGIHFSIVTPHAFDDRIRTTKSFLSNGNVYFDKEHTEGGFLGLMNYRRRMNEQLSTEDRPVYFDEPKDGLECHIADSFGHMAVTYFTNKISGRKMGEREQAVVEPENAKQQYSYNPWEIG